MRRLAIAALLASACVHAPVAPPAGRAAESPIHAAAAERVQLAGRDFQLTALSAPFEGKTIWVLEIVGDGIVISFAAQAEPHAASVSGDTVHFGAHTFQAGGAPNHYVVDGAEVTLEPGGAYVFDEGKFIARRR